ncbi:MAG: tetratricopeptide repeat protein [Ignavibacteria bacterium]|nr:tetratricopeptide repeat protein [Ignavibacteria bacterium]
MTYSKIFFIALSIFSLSTLVLCERDPVADAKQAISKGDYETALSKLREAYEEKEHRKKFEVNFLLASTHYHLNAPDSAIFYYIKAREISPESTSVYIGLGNSYVKNNLSIPAIEQFKKAISIDSTLVAIHFQLGKLYRQQRDYNNAAASYQQVISRDTTNIDAYRELAEIFSKAKQHTNAARMFKRLTTLLPEDVDLKISLMRSLISARSIQEAIPVAEQIIEKNSSNYEARHILAKGYYETRNYVSAEKELLFIQQYDTLSSDEILRLARSQVRLQKHLDAIATFETYLATTSPDSSFIDVYTTLGELYMTNQRYDSAIATFNKRISYDSNAISAYMNAGICKMQLKDYKSAVTFFQQVTTRKSEYVKGHLYLARTYALMEEYKQEGIVYKKMLEVIADSTEKYKTEVAEAYGFEGFYNFFLGQQIWKDNKEEGDRLYTQAAVSLRKAITFDSASVQNNLLLAQLLQNMNKKEEAIKHYRIVLKLDPKNKEAKTGLDVLLEKK